MYKFGEKVKARRNELRLTQKQLEAKTGIAQTEISRIEKERIKHVEIDRLRKLAQGLEVSADWLLELEPTP